MNKNQLSDQDAPFWRNHVSQWRDSGLKQAAYCRQQDLSPHSFSYYKRKFSDGHEPIRRKPTGFVNVQVKTEPTHCDLGTPAGANASAIHYSLIETAKMHGLEPYAYLNAVFKALPYADTVEKIEDLLP